MDISAILSRQAVASALEASSKKRVLQEVAAHFARSAGLVEREVYMALAERERLGSTAVGGGVAIPHARFSGLSELKAAFVRLSTPVDFESPDGEPVDLLMILFAPEGNQAMHVRAMASAARILRDKKICEKLRSAVTADVMYAILTAKDEEVASE